MALLDVSEFDTVDILGITKFTHRVGGSGEKHFKVFAHPKPPVRKKERERYIHMHIYIVCVCVCVSVCVCVCVCVCV